MDRNHYYRILGVRPESTPAQIRAAYETRMARLSSPDYADDPGYARRKKEQATKAYRVLMGSAPPTSETQKRAYFEKFKDAIENREGMDKDDFDDETSSRTKIRLPKISFGRNKYRNSAKSAKVVAIIVVLTILTAVISIVGAIVGIVDTVSTDYSYDEPMYTEEIQNANEVGAGFGYMDMLDTSTISSNQSKIDWDVGVDDYGEDPLFSDMLDVLYWFDIYDTEEFFAYVTGDEDFYYDCDDYDCAVEVINWITAPTFESIAGSINEYTGEPILSMADYMEFLEEYVYEHV